MKTTLVRTASLLLPLAGLLAITAPAVPTPTNAAATPESEEPSEQPFEPKSYPLSKYAQFEKKSPFEFDPPPPDQPIVQNNFDGVSLGGFCGTGSTLSVYLLIGKEKKRITVYGDGSPMRKRDESGFRIVSLNRANTISKTTVTLEKGGQTAEVKFEKETLTAKGAGGAAGGQIQMVPDGKGGMIPRQVVPRPSGAPAAPQAAYQAPSAFIPGQQNNNMAQGNAPGGIPQGQVNVNNGGGTMSPQQAIGQMTHQANIPQAQPGNPVPGQTNVNGQPQPRRRVVLPTQTPPP